jgi:hypothetical protein
MHLGVSFIAQRQLGAIGDQHGRLFLPSVEWCTELSGAPPDNNYSSPVCDLLPYRARPTVGPQDVWRTGHCLVHTGQSSVPNRPLERATRRPLIVLATVGSADLTHRTVWCTIGQSGDF